MKPAAREARPPRRLPGLRWALLPLLLLCRLGQILCTADCGATCGLSTVTSTATEIRTTEAPGNLLLTDLLNQTQKHITERPDGTFSFEGLAPGTSYVIRHSEDPTRCCEVRTKPSPVYDTEIISVSPTHVILTWKNDDSAASKYEYKVKSEIGGELNLDGNQRGINITGLRPATSYNFSITPVMNGTPGDATYVSVTTEPLPVSDLRVASEGVMKVVLTWKTENSSATCEVLREDIGSLVNISDLKPGTKYKAILNLLESSETQGDSVGAEQGSAATGPGSSAHTPRSPTAPVYEYKLESTDLSSVDPLSGDTEVLLLGLKCDTQYKARVYARAPGGIAGQPTSVDFRTNCSQVFDVEAVNISATSMSLTWKISDESPSDYTYHIQVVGGTAFPSFTVQETQAFISPLSGSTLYNVTVRPFLQGSVEGVPGFLQVYTRPGPVSDFRVTSVTTRSISLAWSSNDSNSFRILTTQAVPGTLLAEITTNQSSIVVGDLYPGTKYCFEIFPQGPNGTEGDSQTVCSVTDASGVFDIRVVSVTTTEMQLEWQNTDNASDFIYHLDLESERGSHQMNSSHKAITLTDLTPGTLYNITIVPEVNGVRGRSGFTAQYTRPSNVSDIEISTNTTAATFNWRNSDEASNTYTYRLLIEREGNSSQVTERVTGLNITSATVAELTPGSWYTVEIFTQVGHGIESLTPGCQSFCTDPAPVASFRCEEVPRKPALVLQWACPSGTSTGFQLELSRGDWRNTTTLEGCSSENGTEYRTEVVHLEFSTSYDVNITALSCDKTAPPAQNTCVTGITDPPPPDGAPNITSISHNSVKVKFSGFEASHGPIKAYALILTTGEANLSADVLSQTYADFKNGDSPTYVTYLMTTKEETQSQDSPEVLKYEIDVGNESTTHGYYNGRLEPLGSYRACVAGFTNITLTRSGLIVGNASYVSFSRYSEAVFLPQDPGVICGAVFGCIFGAMVIVAVGGFIFWRKKRKYAKNNEMSFSQIKPKKSKLIKVENFEAYFKKQQADSNCGFAEEYEDLKLVGIRQPKYAAELAENRGKNRYNNVLPYDISRVKLSVQTHPTDDYINANYMPGYHSKKDFIATQGPLPNTLKDFWRMVWEKNIYAIVMLTKCVEQGRTKCEEYWPSKKAKDYGNITVAMTSEIVLPEWTIRDFTVKNNETSDSHPLRQFHFTSWPDHGVPDTTDLLINFRYLVRDYMKESPPESPVLVHCSAGVGRTGTFIAIDHLIYQMENESAVDVYGIVYDLRMHRPLMVQTEDQYVFLNQCVLDIIRSQKDSKVDLIYQNTTAMTIYENLVPATTFGQTNGYIA